jgi:hypothetical protein
MPPGGIGAIPLPPSGRERPPTRPFARAFPDISDIKKLDLPSEVFVDLIASTSVVGNIRRKEAIIP